MAASAALQLSEEEEAAADRAVPVLMAPRPPAGEAVLAVAAAVAPVEQAVSAVVALAALAAAPVQAQR